MSKYDIIEVKNVKMYFPITKGLLRKTVGYVKAVDDVSFSIKRGETLGLVGESGCGKTTVGRAILSVYKPTSGRIFYDGIDISTLAKNSIKSLRQEMQFIFQDPYGSLNPRLSAGSIVGEPLIIHKLAGTVHEYHEKVRDLFSIVGLDPSMTSRYPHEFSGGQRQRLGIARALSCNPSFIICDEPISALDVSIQAQIINLLEELREEMGLTYLFIAHDLSVVRHISDRIAVMYLGRIVEIAGWEDVYENAQHPYTKALLSAVPIPDPDVEEKRERIILKGDVPSPINPPAGCSFHPRCPIAVDKCKNNVPTLKQINERHQVACILAA